MLLRLFTLFTPNSWSVNNRFFWGSSYVPSPIQELEAQQHVDIMPAVWWGDGPDTQKYIYNLMAASDAIRRVTWMRVMAVTPQLRWSQQPS